MQGSYFKGLGLFFSLVLCCATFSSPAHAASSDLNRLVLRVIEELEVIEEIEDLGPLGRRCTEWEVGKCAATCDIFSDQPAGTCYGPKGRGTTIACMCANADIYYID